MKILCLNERMGDDASFRARVLPYLSMFAQNNIQVDTPNVIPFMPVSVSPGYDLVWIRRLLFLDSKFWNVVKDIPIIYELDDAIYLPQDSVNYQNFKFMMTKATLVIAGNDVLAEEARKCGASNVCVIRTGVDVSKYQLSVQAVPPKIVWTGSQQTLPYLYDLESVLKKLCDEQNIKVKVICDKVPKWNIKSENVLWNDSFQYSMQDCSIGISPLPDDQFTNGKCAYKIIQYMASGLPVICSSVGTNKVIFDMYNIAGNCVSGADQFYSPLLHWANKSSDERIAAGLVNRKIVEQNFDIHIIFNQMLEKFRGVL